MYSHGPCATTTTALGHRANAIRPLAVTTRRGWSLDDGGNKLDAAFGGFCSLVA